MAIFAVWWIEIVVAVIGVMCLALVIREAAVFVNIRGIRQRDGGVPVPRTKDEYLLLFPNACPRCLSRGRKRVRGWHIDQYGASEFVETWQCADCAYVACGNLGSPAPQADVTEQSVRARQRWFIS